MAKPKASSAKHNPSVAPTSPDADAGEWVQLGAERYLWKLEEGGILQGYLLASEYIEPKNGRPFTALLIRTTKSVLVTNRDDEVIEAPPGTDILVPVTHKLQKLVTVAEHPQFVYEVRIELGTKVDIGAGQSMWTYKQVAAKKTPKPRDDFGPMFSAFEPHVTPALPESNGVDAFPAQ